jgi:hypothetical protein
MATVDETMMKVQRILTGPMDLSVSVSKDHFVVKFTDSSTSVMMRVQEWGTDTDGEPRTLVLITAPILNNAAASPELFEWVARKGGSRWFGHVEVYDGSEPGCVNLLMSHTLLGDYLDPKELEHGMYAVLTAADAWDDELQPRFGGKRLIDS